MKSVGVHPTQQEMQNLVRLEISALKSDWGALQEHEKGFYRIPPGWAQITYIPLGFGINRVGVTIFLNFLWGAPRCTPVHPGWGSEVGCIKKSEIESRNIKRK